MRGFLEKIFPAGIFTLPVIIAALGYFVDVFDMYIFGANRIASLTDIGVPQEEIFDTGVMILNLQMAGMFIGGLLFGILGDKFGRTKMMFLSIVTYSIATFMNGFVDSVAAYATFRFIAGLGLAGELGLAITLISETMPKDKRGYGAGIICGFGILGGLCAALLALVIPWRMSFIIGGLMGLALLFFRVRIAESHMFEGMKEIKDKGKISMVFQKPERIIKFLHCVSLLLPVWYVIGVLVYFSPELLKVKYGLEVTVPPILAFVMFFLAMSDFVSAWISNAVKSRKKVLIGFISLGLIMVLTLLLSPVDFNYPALIIIYVGAAIGCGCWVLGVTAASESFGTNLRATITTSVPNFSRAATIPITLSVAALKEHMPLDQAALIVGLVVYALALFGAFAMRETFAADLDYLEK